VTETEIINAIAAVTGSLIAANQGYGLYIKVRAETRKANAEAKKLGIDGEDIQSKTLDSLWASLGRMEDRLNQEIQARTDLEAKLQSRIRMLENILRQHRIPVPDDTDPPTYPTHPPKRNTGGLGMRE
jgi:hypothetical protein